MRPIRCILKKGKEKAVLRRHPWVYSGAIDQIEEDYQAGDVVKVFSSDERFLGMGYLNPRSQIAIRMLAFDDVSINPGFFVKRIREAVAMRERFLPPETNAYRLIHSEGDFLPGLVCDYYNGYLVAQFLTAGIERWRDEVVKILEHEVPVKGIFEKDDAETREWEGLEKRVEKLAGEEPPDFIEISENGICFVVDIHRGQKTGFFLDQRDNRKLVQGYCRHKRVLNCFAYTGAFSVYAAKGGAQETVSVEVSDASLNTAKQNFEINGISADRHTFVREDVFEFLRSSRQEFDVVILDPPAFCKNKHQIDKALAGYKDINLYAMKRLAPGGILFTSSCSSHIGPEMFQEVVFNAAKDTRREAQIIQKTSHPFDHPINIYHPEGEYLKGLLCNVR